ncbi:GAF domain-containing protein [Nocardia tenerifensis]|uniref:GAF domain-containing protein n=1 Tax=Nocardia tenerifensis TaxID=228006 RepID=A0A318K6Y7_9NOCA|nr:GAF domain-containing protein [Nocardia tenerifensis]PXX69098.1 GAF domain-containing protein [Nocardia tenerifensis]
MLHLARHLGFTPAFLDYFAAVDADVPSACALALTTGRQVLVDEVASSPVFDGQTRAVMLASGSRAVQTYPLFDDHGGLLGMLSMHYHRPGLREDHEPLAKAAATALASLDTVVKHASPIP